MKITLKPGQPAILIFNLVAVTAFSVLFVSRQNYEFLLYIGVILFFLGLILLTNDKVDFPNSVLWGLTAWALLHMAGGGLYLDGQKFYELMLVPLVGEPYHIFKYDQFVHIVGFATATLVMYHLAAPLLRPDLKKWTALSIIIVMAGLGAGALNEIVEFTATVLMPETGVGGYVNTSLDLVADLVGALLALLLIRLRERKPR